MVVRRYKGFTRPEEEKELLRCSIYIAELPKQLVTKNRKAYVERNFMDAYEYDLGFSRPRSFDLSMYRHRGIYLEESWKHADIYRRIRLLSVVREQKVFILLGKYVRKFFPAIEKNNNHMVYIGDGFNMDISREHTFMSEACSHLKVSREIWRM